MKKIAVVLILLLCMAIVAQATMTHSVATKPNRNWWSGNTSGKDVGWDFLKEVESLLNSNIISSSTVDMNNVGLGQIAFGYTGYENIILDLRTANTAGWFSTSGVTAWDFNGTNLTDIGKVGFTTANLTDINTPAIDQISMGSSAKESFVIDFATTNTIGFFSKSGVTTWDFNNSAGQATLDDVNLGTSVSFDVSVLDVNADGATDPNTWLANLVKDANGVNSGIQAGQGIAKWGVLKFKGTTYYFPVFTGSPSN